MKLDVNVLRYLSKDDFRVLTAVEMGMRNHEIVPAELIDSIASLKRGGSYKVLKNLLKHKLVHHDSSKYDGFRLTYLGYDFLAIKALVNRGVFISVGRKIGVGKESDIFEVAQEDGTVLAMKLHRLGRESFRAVKNKRDYLKHRSNYNWLYLSRLAALREFSFMKALEEHGFAVPQAVDCNRHCVIMSLIEGYPLVQVKQLQHPDIVFETIIGLVTRLAEHGLIHCDFNEFNIMIDDEENVTMIDFPQMVSVSHPNAQMYFDRDVDSIFKFFSKRFNLSFQGSVDETLDETEDAELNEAGRPLLSSIKKIAGLLDKELAASGFTLEDQERFEQLTKGGIGNNLDSDEEEVEEEDDGAILEEFESLGILEEESNEAEDLDRGTEMKTEGGTEEHDPRDEGKQIEEDDPEIKNTETKTKGGHEEHDPEEGEQTEEDDPELKKRLNRQRKHAIKAAKGGKKTFSSRNTYKDKGRSRSSSNSKIQKHLSSW